MSSRTKINRKTILKLVGNRRKPIPGTCAEEWAKEINKRIGAGPQTYPTTLELLSEMLKDEQIVFAKVGNGKLRIRPASEVSETKRVQHKDHKTKRRVSIRYGDVPLIEGPEPYRPSFFERINERFEAKIVAAELERWPELIAA